LSELEHPLESARLCPGEEAEGEGGDAEEGEAGRISARAAAAVGGKQSVVNSGSISFMHSRRGSLAPPQSVVANARRGAAAQRPSLTCAGAGSQTNQKPGRMARQPSLIAQPDVRSLERKFHRVGPRRGPSCR
jgi:hypothetical protein